ncbi:MAG: hypothetical protein KDA81_09280, partial [Planctomycetaceae bacterium]|nr:hypothetical protein [Planctomycetaceae bacterium]
MKNQPLHPLFHSSAVDRDALVDPPPDRRFGMLMLVYVTGVLIVLGRIAWVQGTLQERYLAALSATVVEYELIPARDGRILAGPSTVLATDVDQYSVQVHYRWLQEPVDETWLKQQTRRQLNSADRRQPELVAAFRQDRLQQRNEMWERLQQLLPIDAEQLNARRQAIRKQVTRIAESVNRRYVSEQNDDPSATAESDVDDSQQQTGMLMRIAGAVRRALTTPPNRSAGERIVVREEESWHSVADNVPLEIAAQIRENAHLYPGVRVVAGNQRSYPGGNLAAHVVGSRTPARDDEPQLWEQSVTSDSWKSRIGRTGVERSYHHQLKSIPGLRQIERNRRFEILREEVVRLPVAGQDLHLTLDARLQQFAEQALGQALLDLPPVDEEVKLEKDAASSPTESDAPGSAQPVPTGGCVVVMNVSTGELLVAASAPAFDL